MIRRPLGIYVIAVFFYGVLLSVFFTRRYHHDEIILFGVLHLIVLPATIYLLRSKPEPIKKLWPVVSPQFLFGMYLISALSLSWITNQGLLIPDEMAYQFQARVFALGQLFADAPPGALEHSSDTPAALYFEHHIIDHGRWFGKYPLGWPLILALPLRLKIGWVLNPILGLAILGLMYLIAQRLFDRSTASLAVVMAVLSPFFLANFVGRMSHVACGVFLAIACLFCFEGLRSLRIGAFTWMLVAIGAACQVRPATGVAVGMALALPTLWHVRRTPIWGRVLLLCLSIGTVTIAAVMLYNATYTGRYFVSPYVLAKPDPLEAISFSPLQMLNNLGHNSRWAVQETIFYSFPFAFVLAAYAFFYEVESRREVNILASLFPVLIAVYLIEPSVPAELNGERYYFESFFAVLILAARGTTLLVREFSTSRQILRYAMGLLAALAIVQQAGAGRNIVFRSEPYRQMRLAAERFEGKHYLVFWRTSPPQIFGKHFNLNRPDWQKQDLFYLVDPAPEERNAWACRLGRPNWVVIGYDSAEQRVIEESARADNCKAE